jgi:acyl-coenzyme A synthetase/AMP-(fatty) acid ligase/acyl carrier protein
MTTILDLIPGDSDVPAVVCDGRSLTYRQLDDRAGRLAADLHDRGVRADDIVGIRLPRGIGFVIAVLAVWKAGAAYLPLDPALPAARLDHMIADSRPTTIVTDVSPASTVGFTADIHPGQAAYVIYTSGTTGQPKGVINTHEGLLNLVTGLGPLYGLEPGDPALQFASFNFDAATADIALALTSGATLVVATTDERDNLAPLIGEHGIRHLNISPTLLATLDDLLPDSTLIVGSEPFPPRLAQTWAGKHRVHNAYGPTEAAVITTISLLRADGTKPSIGQALPGTGVYLLDPHLGPAPTGEIHLAGPSLARGYHRRPALTAERFVPNPLATDGSRMYRTGDLARILPGGDLDHLGRTDQQLKIRGHRIEPTEIEHALTRIPQVKAAIVVGHEDRLIAYLVPDGDLPSSRELRELLGATLPDYMVPALFIEIGGIPLTVNGKRDLSALPTPQTATTGQHVPPATATEQVVAEIWAGLFGLDRVGATGNFFDLGGHSLIATQAIAAIRRRFAVDLTAAEFYDNATVRAVAGLVEDRILLQIEQMSEDEAIESLDAPTPHRGDTAR